MTRKTRKILLHSGNGEREALTGRFPARGRDRGLGKDAFSIPKVEQKRTGRGSQLLPGRGGKPSSTPQSTCRGSEFGTAGHVRSLFESWYTLPYIILIIRILDFSFRRLVSRPCVD